MTSMLLIGLAGVVAASRATRPLPGRAASLLRVLVPSWRFFEDVCEQPSLYIRNGDSPTRMGPWRECLPLASPQVLDLLSNPEGNLALACNGVLQQLLADSAWMSADQLHQSVSYRLTRQLVIYFQRPDGYFQFKLCAALPGEAPEDVVISSVHLA